MVSLTKANIENTSTRPVFISEYEAQNLEGQTETRYSIKLPKVPDGTAITLKVASNPAEWPEKEGKFGKSHLAHFETEDGTVVSMFIAPNMKAAGRTGPLQKGVPAPPGKSLLQRFQEFKQGDIVRLGLEVRKTQAGDRTWRCFTVEPATGFQ